MITDQQKKRTREDPSLGLSEKKEKKKPPIYY